MKMRFVIGAVALLVLGSVFGSLAAVLFWPDLSYATSRVRGMRLERDNMFLHTNRHHGLRLPDRP
jgi:hypothetical protein